MSWDIFIQDLPDVATVADIPNDFKPAPIGREAELIAKIGSVVPFIEKKDSGWYSIDQSEVVIDLSISEDEESGQAQCVTLFVRGGARAAGCVAAIVKVLEHRALDSGTGDFFNPDDPETGYEQWVLYRDQILRTPEA